MQEVSLYKIFLDKLESRDLSYMVTGSVAATLYGEPRVTHDIDLVLELHAENIPDFINLFAADQFYCPPPEVIQTEISRETRGHFNLIHHESGLKADIYPVGSEKLHEWAMGRRQKVKFEQINIWLAPPEYVILRKLQFYCEGGSVKHLRDIKKMLDVSGDIINHEELKQKITELGLLEQWRLVHEINH